MQEGARKPRFRLERPTATAKHLRNNTNEIEDALWQRLRRSQLGGFKFSRQIPRAGAYPDFICRRLKLVLELDGSQHFDAQAYDARRTSRLEQQGHTVIRFWNSDVLTNMDGVLEIILAECLRLAGGPPPDPFPHAGGGERE